MSENYLNALDEQIANQDAEDAATPEVASATDGDNDAAPARAAIQTFEGWGEGGVSPREVDALS